jgi:hypothetical protein
MRSISDHHSGKDRLDGKISCSVNASLAIAPPQAVSARRCVAAIAWGSMASRSFGFWCTTTSIRKLVLSHEGLGAQFLDRVSGW